MGNTLINMLRFPPTWEIKTVHKAGAVCLLNDADVRLEIAKRTLFRLADAREFMHPVHLHS